METTIAHVPNISCGHCVATIKRELGDIAGVEKVDGDPGTKKITVEWQAPATWNQISATLTEIGFPAAD
jgi:copper chaperone CopZ